MRDKSNIIVVSGLPRSGTSMMMQMLEAGGMEILSDGARKADDDNPRGYYELEAIKRLKDDQSCLREAQGKVVKIISELLKYLPPSYDYAVIFIHREIAEILESQKKMLARRGEPIDRFPDERLSELFQKHLSQLELWLNMQPNIRVLSVDYKEVVESPTDISKRLGAFLDSSLHVEKMALAVDRLLYRNRK